MQDGVRTTRWYVEWPTGSKHPQCQNCSIDPEPLPSSFSPNFVPAALEKCFQLPLEDVHSISGQILVNKISFNLVGRGHQNADTHVLTGTTVARQTRQPGMFREAWLLQKLVKASRPSRSRPVFTCLMTGSLQGCLSQQDLPLPAFSADSWHETGGGDGISLPLGEKRSFTVLFPGLRV